jgi:transposase-like protein
VRSAGVVEARREVFGWVEDDSRSGATQTARIGETYVKTRGKWRYLYRAIDKHGNPIDFLLTAKRDLDAAKRFFHEMLKDEPLLSPAKIGTDGASTFPRPSRRPSMTGTCIRSRFIMSPSTSSKASRVTTFE